VSRQEESVKNLLESAPYLRGWVNECASCHHRGYVPQTPQPRFDNMANTLARLRRLLNEQSLDENGRCEQCRGLSSTNHLPDFERKSSPLNLDCEERKRLDAAYREALRSKEEVESRLCEDLVSPDSNAKKQAKHELDKAAKHVHNILRELSVHGKKHGCGL
jgi:hypothetical protein